MSQLSERAICSIMLAEYAAISETGKLNVVGGSISGVTLDSTSGSTTRFSVVAMTHAPGDLLPVDAVIELALYQRGELYLLPGPQGPSPIRIGQETNFDFAPAFHGRDTKTHVGSRQSIVLDLSNGLPLPPGSYEWVVRIDGDVDNEVREPFAVIGAPSQPVIG